ncbi:MAG TPA: hypothetical protein VLN49_05190 [Gemmatimonadaceae bacterium]|nr:hypothetical protein [Gemmatimonadaceae bacterium]
MRTDTTPWLDLHRLSPTAAAWRLAFIVAVVAVTSPASFRAQTTEPPHVHPAAEKLGTVSFPNSGAAAAQPDFLRGLALLHNFEYGDAARAFRSAEQRDPSFAIAYWLDAMTYSHMLWSEEDLTGARAVLARLGPTSAARLPKAGTPRERAYGAAVEAFLAPVDARTRARAFADSMRHLAEAYPKDLEAHAFTALAIMLAADNAESRDESNRL